MKIADSDCPPARGFVGPLETIDSYPCGPVNLRVAAERQEWRVQAASMLGSYPIEAGESGPVTTIYLRSSEGPTTMTAGKFLRTRNIHVDRTRTGIVATCHSGVWAQSNAALDCWTVSIPPRPPYCAQESFDANVLDLLELVLTTAWRQAGWIPLHAAAVAKGDRCAILAAPSFGGKTTLTVAMLNLGWDTLGDDGLLLRMPGGEHAELRALHDHMNLDPRTRKWFPEVGDLSRMAPYSIWTPKRRIRIESVWKGRLRVEAHPTHLVQVFRCPDHRRTRTEPLSRSQVLAALLAQTVVPGDRTVAAQILSVVAPLSSRLHGLRLELGEDAYGEPQTRRLLERMLE